MTTLGGLPRTHIHTRSAQNEPVRRGRVERAEASRGAQLARDVERQDKGAETTPHRGRFRAVAGKLWPWTQAWPQAYKCNDPSCADNMRGAGDASMAATPARAASSAFHQDDAQEERQAKRGRHEGPIDTDMDALVEHGFKERTTSATTRVHLTRHDDSTGTGRTGSYRQGLRDEASGRKVLRQDGRQDEGARGSIYPQLSGGNTIAAVVGGAQRGVRKDKQHGDDEERKSMMRKERTIRTSAGDQAVVHTATDGRAPDTGRAPRVRTRQDQWRENTQPTS